MYMNVLLIACTLFLARNIAGYDSRYNNHKYFSIKNKFLASVFLPKSTGFSRHNIKRAKSDFNKMTFVGLSFYICNLIIIISIPVLLFFVPEIKTMPFEMESRYLYIFVDTANEKIPILLTCILLAAEIIFECLKGILHARKENKKFLIIIFGVLLFIAFLFGIIQIKELTFLC